VKNKCSSNTGENITTQRKPSPLLREYNSKYFSVLINGIMDG
jgi:hypothetical protein